MVREVKPTAEKIDDLFQDLLMVYDLSESEKPTAIIVAGVSGSGKSTLIKQFYTRFDLNYFPIQADDYRSSHPKIDQYIEKYGRDEAHKRTGNFAHRCARALLGKAISHKFNVIYETTFNNIETADSLLDVFKMAHYRIVIIALPIDVELSIRRNQERYKNKLSIDGTLPRIVEKDIIEKMAVNYQQCVEHLKTDNLITVCQVENSNQAIEKIFTLL